MEPPVQQGQRLPRSTLLLNVSLLVATALLSYGSLVLPFILSPAQLPLQAGDVAPYDLKAPRAAEFVSEVRTEDARQAAERAVPPVYAMADTSVVRKQIDRLRATLNYISIVRTDTYASDEQKRADLAALSDVQLKPETIQSLLALPQARWDTIQQESLSVLEQVMRNTIRETNLEATRRSVPSLVSLALTEEQARLVAELVSAFVVPNSLFSQDLTDAARLAAREAVEPVVRSFKSGETVVRGGAIVTPADLEALRQLGLIESRPELKDYLGALALVLTVAFFTWFYFERRKPAILQNPRSVMLIAALFIAFLATARTAIPNHTLIPYFFPIPAFGLLIAILFHQELGLVLSILLSILVAYGLPNTLDLSLYYVFSSICGVLVLGPARRVWAFFLAGGAIALAGTLMVLAYRLPFTQIDLAGVLTLAGAAVLNGFLISSSVALLGQYFLAQSLGLTTPLQLMEISRPDFPLLKYFLLNAPGTYQHSLQVSNLAEQAAERIGADALQVRVGALFHDVGKATNPSFFVENQPSGNLDTHDDLEPADVASTIIRHVTEGVVLARKHRLPRRIDDFILEHHGTQITRYQYNQALERAGGDIGKVDLEKFRYPGPHLALARRPC